MREANRYVASLLFIFSSFYARSKVGFLLSRARAYSYATLCNTTRTRQGGDIARIWIFHGWKTTGDPTSQIVMPRRRAHKRGKTRAVSRKKIIRHVLRAASSRSRQASFPCICKSPAIVPVALHRRVAVSAIFKLFSDSLWRKRADI